MYFVVRKNTFIKRFLHLQKLYEKEKSLVIIMLGLSNKRIEDFEPHKI